MSDATGVLEDFTVVVPGSPSEPAPIEPVRAPSTGKPARPAEGKPARPAEGKPARPAEGKPARPAEYQCPECRHVLRVSGLGRHRLYFELDDQRADLPVIDRVCPQCGHGLPGKNPR